MISFDKTEIKESLTIENIFDLLQEWGGDPEYTNFGIISATICHNIPGEGSRKLYYYENSGLFKCYTGCDDIFDIFELAIKVGSIQFKKNLDLNDAIRLIAYKFGIIVENEYTKDDSKLEDWDIFNRYEKIQNINDNNYQIVLKSYNEQILNNLNYNVRITPWEKEGISKEIMKQHHIGFFPGEDQITIPHYDENGRFIGLRGRTLCQEDAERFGKYRPIYINNITYTHPLGMNLYNLNNSKQNIEVLNKAIIFESEKSCMLYSSYFGPENDISVACCGSSISSYQINMLLKHNAKEIIVAFDRQFKEIGDEEFKHLTKNLTKINNKYKNYATISLIFDKHMITGYKDAPIDCGPEKFL